MRILIKERECTYKSDYPEGWEYSSGDYFKFPVMIKADAPSDKTYPCFVKRFEKKDPAAITGWDLLVKLKNKNEQNLTRVYDIASVEENGKRVYYVFYEFYNGNTLKDVITNNVTINLTRLTNDLFQAFASLRNYGYWFADFVEKNIFLENSGKFLLMDLDSAQPAAKLPHDDLYGSKDYWVLVFAFYKRIMGYNDLKVADLSGLSLNHLQIVFLVLRLKVSFDTSRQQFIHSDTFNELPEKLDEIAPTFKELFAKIYNERTSPDYTEQEEAVRNMIIEKIIPYEQEQQQEDQVTPAIEEFTVSPDMVEKGEPFELKWKVRNATSVELHKNGVFDTRFTPQEKGITKTAFYDGKTKTISYKLIAIRGDELVESIPVDVRFKEKNGQPLQQAKKQQPAKEIIPDVIVVPPVVPDQHTELLDQEPEKEQKTPEKKEVEKINRVMRMVGIGVAVLVVTGIILLIRWWPSSKAEKPFIVKIDPAYVYNQHQPVTISVSNLPLDSNAVQVILNDVPATIQQRFADSLVVMYPDEADQTRWRGSVRVGVIYNRDTVFSAKDILVLKHLSNPDSNLAVPELPVQQEETTTTNPPDVNTGTVTTDPSKMTAEEKKRATTELLNALKKRREELEKKNQKK